ncbi:sodium/glucose cotransporter 4-like [Diadema setosum]|uniref:sodium/glucose cotransporter 4-like n=1 Tax=Diadema setosum TaxID=31175 RepID=UPI003B3BB527
MLRSNRGNAEGYFLAGGSMIWLPVGASLFASNIGSEHFIGLAGSGAASGIAVGAFELNALIILQILGWVFLPVYLASGIFTLPEYLQKRFGGVRLRMIIAFVSLILYIFTKISVDLYSGALFIEQALGWNLYVSILVLLAISAVYTVTGGLAAVIYTDTVQAIIMLGGALWLCIESFNAIGGYDNLEPLYGEAVPNETKYGGNECGEPRDDFFSMLRDPIDSDLPWPGFIFGQTTASLWYWTTDQVIVQRTLAAKNLSHGKGGTILAGICKITPLFFIVMPGMVARILYPDIVACVENCEEICGSEDGCSNLAYPLMVMNLLPKGARGLMMAVMLSALMSSLTSIFNSGSSIFTMDIWRHFRRFPSEKDMAKIDAKSRQKYDRELMIVGRIVVLVLVAVSVLWVPVVQNSQNGKLFDYIQQITSYMAPSLAAIYTLAVLIERVNETGAFWGLMSALVIGAVRMILDFVYPEPGCGEVDDRPEAIQALLFHYMYFALFLFCWTVLIVLAISLLTEPIPKEYLYRLTYCTRFSREERLEFSQKKKFNAELNGNDNPVGPVDQEAVEMKESYRKVDEAGAEAKKHDEAAPSSVAIEKVPDVECMDRSSAASIEAEQSIFKRFYNWFCGFSPSNENTVSDEDMRLREEQQMEKVIQTKRDRLIVNAFACAVIGTAIFLYIWYG